MKSLVFSICTATLLTGPCVIRADDQSRISGVFACFSGERDTVGRVVLQWTGKTEGSNADTYKMVWMVNDETYIGVGFLIDNVLTAGWATGIGRYQLEGTTDGGARLKGWSMKSGDAAKTFDHSLVFMRPIRDDEYFKGDVVAVNYEEDDYWYYARVEEKTDKGYKISYLAGDGDADVSVNDMMRYAIRVGDRIESTSANADVADFYAAEVTDTSAVSTWVSEEDTVTLDYVAEEGGLTGEIEVRGLANIRFIPRSDSGDQADGSDATETPATVATESPVPQPPSDDTDSDPTE